MSSPLDSYTKATGLTPQQLRAMLTPRWSRYIPHKPHPTQVAFLLLTCLEAFYGGAASGGKSDALLMAALQYIDVPGYAALILRRSYADLSLPNAIMDRARTWLAGKPGVRWVEKDKTFYFECPGGGHSSLTFGYLESENDKYRYAGAELQLVAFDELTQFTETQYQFLFSRLRKLKSAQVPLRMRSASNPGGVGHEWVKARFIPSEQDTPEKRDRIFIPAKITDNPSVDQDSYIRSLDKLNPLLKAQLLQGDWEIAPEGTMFEKSWFRVLEVRDVVALKFTKLVRYWDMAASEEEEGKDPDWTVGTLMGRTSDKEYVILDVVRFREAPGNTKKRVRAVAEQDENTYGKGKVDVWMEQEPGSAGIAVIDMYRKDVLPEFPFRGNKATGEKKFNAMPLATNAQAGIVHLLRGAWNEPWLNEVVTFPLKGYKDDQVDSASGAFGRLFLKNTFSVGTLDRAEERLARRGEATPPSAVERVYGVDRAGLAGIHTEEVTDIATHQSQLRDSRPRR